LWPRRAVPGLNAGILPTVLAGGRSGEPFEDEVEMLGVAKAAIQVNIDDAVPGFD